MEFRNTFQTNPGGDRFTAVFTQYSQFAVNCWLVVWNIFFHILGIIIPTDFNIFQRGRSTTNQVIILGMMQVTSGQKSSKVIGPGSTKNSNHRELQDDHVDAVWRFCKISPDNSRPMRQRGRVECEIQLALVQPIYRNLWVKHIQNQVLQTSSNHQTKVCVIFAQKKHE